MGSPCPSFDAIFIINVKQSMFGTLLSGTVRGVTGNSYCRPVSIMCQMTMQHGSTRHAVRRVQCTDGQYTGTYGQCTVMYCQTDTVRSCTARLTLYDTARTVSTVLHGKAQYVSVRHGSVRQCSSWLSTARLSPVNLRTRLSLVTLRLD